MEEIGEGEGAAQQIAARHLASDTGDRYTERQVSGRACVNRFVYRGVSRGVSRGVVVKGQGTRTTRHP